MFNGSTCKNDLYQSLLWPSVAYHSWYKSLYGSVCWGGGGLFLQFYFFQTDTCLFKLYFCISGVTLYVCVDWRGGASARFLACVFALRVIFFEENLSMELYLFKKKLIVKLFFCPGDIWRHNSHHYKKVLIVGPFLLYICEVMRLDGRGWNISSLLLHFFILLSWF